MSDMSDMSDMSISESDLHARTYRIPPNRTLQCSWVPPASRWRKLDRISERGNQE